MTSNGGVVVNANLGNDNFLSNPTKLHIRTTNAYVPLFSRNGLMLTLKHSRVDAKARLYTMRGKGPRSKSEKLTPHFDVDVKSSNGGLDVAFEQAPSDMTFNFSGTTSNAHAVLQLPLEYEGTFYGATTNSRAALILEDMHASDPAGKDRVRVIKRTDNSKSVVKGSVEWAPSDTVPTGRAMLQTSNGKLQIMI